MIVLNLEPYGYSEQAKIKWNELGVSYLESSWGDFKSQSIEQVGILIVRLSRQINEDVIRQFPSLKFVVSATTGLDHIDIQCLENRGVKLISLKGELDFLKTIPSTSEHTWALLLALVRNIPSAMTDVRLGNWNRDQFRGFQLKGRKIGIIGMGRTGSQVAQFAEVFGMTVLYFDPYVEGTPPFIRCASLTDMLSQSDIVSVHVHLSNDTNRMINADILSFAKEGSYWVNTSRGMIWDEQAVFDRLKSGWLKGVATDVLSTEFAIVKMSPLWKALSEGMNVIITPHIGGATWDAMWHCEEFLVDKMKGLLK
ncbi:MAG: NAD(P)-dependent oxidoreductase [Cyclobacteriaceae bacterium]